MAIDNEEVKKVVAHVTLARSKGQAEAVPVTWTEMLSKQCE